MLVSANQSQSSNNNNNERKEIQIISATLIIITACAAAQFTRISYEFRDRGSEAETEVYTITLEDILSSMGT